jgi:hypothetical protein
MNQLVYVFCCLILSFVFSACWGGLFLLIYPSVAMPVGLVLFVLCFLALMNADKGTKEEEFPQHNRRFDDV